MVDLPKASGKKLAHEIIKLRIEDPDLNFEKACDLSRMRAREINKHAMMLAWFDRRNGEGFPNYDCGAGDKPPWQVFADARGGNLTIDVNDGDFIFIYLKF